MRASGNSLCDYITTLSCELEKQQQLVVWRIVVLKGQKEYKPDHTSHISCSCAFSLIIYFNNKSRKRKKFLWFYGFSIAWVPRKVNCKKDGGFLFLVCFLKSCQCKYFLGSLYTIVGTSLRTRMDGVGGRLLTLCSLSPPQSPFFGDFCLVAF